MLLGLLLVCLARAAGTPCTVTAQLGCFADPGKHASKDKRALQTQVEDADSLGACAANCAAHSFGDTALKGVEYGGQCCKLPRALCKATQWLRSLTHTHGWFARSHPLSMAGRCLWLMRSLTIFAWDLSHRLRAPPAGQPDQGAGLGLLDAVLGLGKRDLRRQVSHPGLQRQLWHRATFAAAAATFATDAAAATLAITTSPAAARASTASSAAPAL